MTREQNNDCGLAVVYEWHCFNCGNVISNERMQNIIYEKKYKAITVKNMPENIPNQARKINTEEETMVTQPVIPVKVPDVKGIKSYKEKGRILGRFYEEHKAEIIEDIEKLGKETARKRWQIPSQTFLNLRRAWDMPIDEKYARHKAAKPAENIPENIPEKPKDEPAPAPEPAEQPAGRPVRDEFYQWLHEELGKLNLHNQPVHFHIHADVELPEYPKFDPTWEEMVKIEWLHIYGQIAAEAK
jgi:hypothetical protein